jgi:hypothetical protein
VSFGADSFNCRGIRHLNSSLNRSDDRPRIKFPFGDAEWYIHNANGYLELARAVTIDWFSLHAAWCLTKEVCRDEILSHFNHTSTSISFAKALASQTVNHLSYIKYYSTSFIIRKLSVDISHELSGRLLPERC